MAATARLAARTRPLARPNPGVAAVLVKDRRVIARGWTQRGGRPHAEAHALKSITAGGAKGAELYVTLEPCGHKSPRGPACCDLVIDAAPSRVIIGQQDPDPRTAGTSIERMKSEGIDVTLLNDPASRRSLSGYFAQSEFGRPYVTLKLAISLDGCIALPDGSSQWITGKLARAHVHSQRARNDAILVGGGTWRADEPQLNVRLEGIENRSPDRVVLTREAQIESVRTINQPSQISQLDGVQHLYVEGGAQTAASFLREDLVDELHLYRAPILIGKGLRGLADIGLADLPSAHGRWESYDNRLLGNDSFTAYLRKR